MQSNLKGTIAALAGVASILALAFLVVLMLPRATPIPGVEISQPTSQEIAKIPDGSGIDEGSRATQEADANENQVLPHRTVAASRKLDATRQSQEAQSTVAVEDNRGTELFPPQNETFDLASVDNNSAIGVAPSRESLENREVAVQEPGKDLSDSASPSAPTSATAENRVSTYLSGRASELLSEIQREGAGLMRHAETLGTFSRNPQFTWQSHAHYLDRVKGHINAVGERTAELQRIRYAVLPWQQQAITDVTAHAAQVAASTNAAIIHLRENQNRLFVTEYRDHLSTIEDRSGDMKQTVDKFLDYEKTQQEFQQLQKELELAGD